MKRIPSTVLLLFLVAFTHAKPFSINGKDIEIPEPEGFSLVTPEMDAVYRFGLQLADSANDLLAFYIAASDAPAALSGNIPSLERYFIVKVNKMLKQTILGSRDFVEFKTVIGRQNQEIFKSIEAQMPGILKKQSEGISKEYNVDLALTLSTMVPLEIHYENDNSFAYSMYVNYGMTLEGAKEDFIVAATATFVNVTGKVVFLYCYGLQKDLEWTRSASKNWAEMVVAGNAPPPARSSGGKGINWSRVLNKGIKGALSGALIALIVGLLSKLKKKKG